MMKLVLVCFVLGNQLRHSFYKTTSVASTITEVSGV